MHEDQDQPTIPPQAPQVDLHAMIASLTDLFKTHTAVSVEFTKAVGELSAAVAESTKANGSEHLGIVDQLKDHERRLEAIDGHAARQAKAAEAQAMAEAAVLQNKAIAWGKLGETLKHPAMYPALTLIGFGAGALLLSLASWVIGYDLVAVAFNHLPGGGG